MGGAEISLETLAAGLPADAYRCSVVLPKGGPLAGRLEARGVEVLTLPHQSWRWWVTGLSGRASFLLTLPVQWMSVWRWVRFLRKVRPDLVHVNLNRLIEPVVAARIARLPTVVHFRDIPSRMEPRFVLGRRAFYKFMNLADCWIANSQATASDIAPHARRPVHVVPNGIDLEEFDRAASVDSAWLPRNGHLVVAMISLLVPWKNHAGFLDMARQACGRRGDVDFLIVGSGDSGYREQLQRMPGYQEIADRVQFLGHVENVPALLRHVDLVVHPTDREPFGRVLIEAMAARRPLVAIGNGGPAEVIVDGETGLLVPPNDNDAMATAVLRLLGDGPLRQRMGAAGRRRVDHCYTAQRHAEAVRRVYDTVLAVQPTPRGAS